MKKNKILSLFLIGMLSVNSTFAEVISLKSGLGYEYDDSQKGYSNIEDKLIVAKKLGKKLSTIDDIANRGDSDAGSYGYSLATGYLTPDKKFGFISIDDNWNRAGAGNVVISYDDLNILTRQLGTTIGTRVWSDYAHRTVYSTTKNAFVGNTSSSSEIYKNLDSVSDVSDTSQYFIQYGDYKDSSGKIHKQTPFVASTMYARWHYDTDSSKVGWGTEWEARNTNANNFGYYWANPILGNKGGNGPYIAINDYIDSELDLGKTPYERYIVQNSLNNDIKTAMVYPLCNIVSGVNSKRVPYLTYDAAYSGTSGSGASTNNAVLEKRFELRKYIIDDVNADKYEVVYGYEKFEAVNQTSIPNKQPDVSVSVTPQSSEASGKTLKYTLSTKIIGADKTYKLSSDKDVTYEIFDDASKNTQGVLNEKNNEPKETEMDMWQTSPTGGALTGKLKITNSDGREIKVKDTSGNYIDSIPVGKQTQTIISDVDLSDCEVTLTVDYTLKSRYMYEKTTFTDLYKNDKNNANEGMKSYSTIMNYVQNLKGYDYVYTSNVNKFHSDTKRVVYKYKTVEIPGLSVEAKNYIFATSAENSNLLKRPVLTIETDPKNITSQLEGGIFNVTTEIKGLSPNISDEMASKPESNPTNKQTYVITNRDDIPDKEKEITPDSTYKFTEWHDNIEILELKIKAPNGTYWFDSTNGVDKITPNVLTQVHFIINNNNLSANPAQVGQGEVTVVYKYTYNYRTETEVVENTELILDAEGNLVPKDYTVTYETHSITQTETQTKYFNIYSISGNTVN